MFGVTSGEELLSIDNTDNATLSFREIARFDTMDGKSKGFIIATMETNSTGTFAALDEILPIGQTEFQTDGSNLVTLWEWQRD
jgi:hypothetical protein